MEEGRGQLHLREWEGEVLVLSLQMSCSGRGGWLWAWQPPGGCHRRRRCIPGSTCSGGHSRTTCQRQINQDGTHLEAEHSLYSLHRKHRHKHTYTLLQKVKTSHASCLYSQTHVFMPQHQFNFGTEPTQHLLRFSLPLPPIVLSVWCNSIPPLAEC